MGVKIEKAIPVPVDAALKATVKGSSIVFAGTVVSLFLWFATKMLIIRNSSVAELGVYSIAIAVAGILSAVSSLGVQDGVVKYIAIFMGEGKREDAGSVASAALRIGTVSGAGFLLILLMSAGLFAEQVFYKPELSAPLIIIAFSIPFLLLLNVLSGVMRGYNLILPKVLFLDVGFPLFFLLFTVVFFFLNLPFLSIIYAYTLAALLCFILMGISYVRLTGRPAMSLKGRYYSKELIRFSVPLLAANILGIVLTWSDTLILGRYTQAQDVGLYNVGVSLAKLLLFPLAALEFVFMPIAGEMLAKGQIASLKRTYQVLTKWVFSATFPIFFILFFFPEMTISFLFADRFVGAALSLRILSVCFLCHAIVGANGVLMIILGRSKDLMKVSLLGTALNIVLNYAFIKHFQWGIAGAASATLLSYFAINIATSFYLYRLSDIQPFTPQYIKPLVCAAAVGYAVYAISKALPLNLWMLPAYLILFLAGYILSLIFTRSLESHDREMVDTISLKTGLEMKGLRRLIYKWS